MNKTTKEKVEQFVYNPVEKWWECFFLWRVYNGKVKVYRYKTKQKEYPVLALFSGGLGIGLAQSLPSILPPDFGFANATSFLKVVAILSIYLFTVVGMIITNKIQFRKNRVSKKLEYCGEVEIEIKNEDSGMIRKYLFVLGGCWVFLIILIATEYSLAIILYFVFSFFIFPLIILSGLGNKLEISKRINI